MCKSRSHTDAKIKRFRNTPSYAAEYLNAVLEDGDQAELLETFRYLAAAFEDLNDIALYDSAKAADDGFRFPSAALHAIIDGAHPVTAWRNYRDLSLEELATIAGINTTLLLQIENGTENGSTATLLAIAQALNVAIENLQE
jgi:DNA-binding phage protein